jgi:hypothetical protein
MVPIQDVLHRIVRDAAFGAGSVVIGYRDRVREVLRDGKLIWRRHVGGKDSIDDDDS